MKDFLDMYSQKLIAHNNDYKELIKNFNNINQKKMVMVDGNSIDRTMLMCSADNTHNKIHISLVNAVIPDFINTT